MVDQCALGWILASVLRVLALYLLFGKNSGVSNERRCESLKNIVTTNEKCKSSNRDDDIIIVGAGVIESSLAYTLAKMLIFLVLHITKLEMHLYVKRQDLFMNILKRINSTLMDLKEMQFWR